MTDVASDDALSECDALESCLETFWCITDEGSDNRLLAEGAIQSAKRLRELLSARTSTAPVGYFRETGLRSFEQVRSDEQELPGVRPLFASPPPPQPGVRVTEALRKVREAILDPINNCSVIDTVWMPVPDGMVPIETLIDFIDAALE